MNIEEFGRAIGDAPSALAIIVGTPKFMFHFVEVFIKPG